MQHVTHLLFKLPPKNDSSHFYSSFVESNLYAHPILQVEEAESQKYPWCWRSPVTILIVAFLIALPLDCQLLKDKNLVQVYLAQ